MKKHLSDESKTLELGKKLADAMIPGLIIYLNGELGAGKTTVVKALIEALGYPDAVTSPTYTIVEPYLELPIPVYHFDLYRLKDPEELEYMGIREYLDIGAICLFEWPERGVGFLPSPDLAIDLDVLDNGRDVTIAAHTEQGTKAMSLLERS